MRACYLLLGAALLLTSCGVNEQAQDPATPEPTPTALPSPSPSPTAAVDPPAAASPTGEAAPLLPPTLTPLPTATLLPSPTPLPTPADPAVTLTQVVPPGAPTPDPPGSAQTPPAAPDPLDAIVAEVIQDLSDRLNIGPEAITLVNVQAVEWRDSSLGCPIPGQHYLQVITPGYQITLEAQGERHDYHTNMRGFFVLCRDGQPAGAGGL